MCHTCTQHWLALVVYLYSTAEQLSKNNILFIWFTAFLLPARSLFLFTLGLFSPLSQSSTELAHGPSWRPNTQTSKEHPDLCSKDLCIVETKEQLDKHVSKHRRRNSSRQDSAVYTHLQHKQHSFQDQDVHILDSEDGRFERCVKEAVCIRVEQASLKTGGSLRHHLSSTYNYTIFTGKHTIDNISHKSCDLACVCQATSLCVFICQS